MDSFKQWVEEHIVPQGGRIALITGANSGLGFESAKVLAQRNARVIMAARDAVKGERAAAEVRRSVPGADVEVLLLDLASLASTRDAAATVAQAYGRLDVLVNNAGVMAIPRRVTADGFEMQLGVNHLGHFALTGLLLPLLLKAPAGRIVTVSSGAHFIGRIRFGALQGERFYQPWLAYAQSKLANLLFAYELQRRLAAVGSEVTSVAAHPGYAATNLQYVGPALTGSALVKKLMTFGNRFFAQSAAMGALPVVYAAAAPDVRGCDYIGPNGLLGQRGYPVKAKSSGRSYDRDLAARLWVISEQLTGVRYHFS